MDDWISKTNLRKCTGEDGEKHDLRNVNIENLPQDCADLFKQAPVPAYKILNLPQNLSVPFWKTMITKTLFNFTQTLDY